VQYYQKGRKFGGSDKARSGHRYDSAKIANGCIEAGMSCQLLHYVPEEHNTFFALMRKFDGIILRVNPDQMKEDGVN